MDDDAAELARLRRRAYGPDADIDRDPSALARLIELEDAVRAPAASAAEAAPTGGAAEAAAPVLVDREPDPRGFVEVPEGAVAAAGAASARPRWHTALVAVVAAAAVVLAAAGATRTTDASSPARSVDPAPTVSITPLGAGSPFAGDPTTRVLITVSIGGSLGDYFDRPVAGDAPAFPVAEDMQWSAPLGRYYGRELWLGRSRSGLPCLAIVAKPDVHAGCTTPHEFGLQGLTVTLPYAEISPADRPDGMTSTESLGFQWLPDQSVVIGVGRRNGLRG
ncbi:hypothetical protein [Microbacterium sp. CJ88]|uniref:hypothetical protein n=1 Tax=Microbacterium sp. CJ88 TaxID=3445672 RepID=UPI003F6578A7